MLNIFKNDFVKEPSGERLEPGQPRERRHSL